MKVCFYVFDLMFLDTFTIKLQDLISRILLFLCEIIEDQCTYILSNIFKLIIKFCRTFSKLYKHGSKNSIEKSALRRKMYTK
jgi:hypothetical protein